MVGKVRAKAYPAREAAGVIWAYMGPAGEEPVFPDFEMLGFPKGHVAAFKMLEECNYAQAVEGTIDSAHAGVLHRESPGVNLPSTNTKKTFRPNLKWNTPSTVCVMARYAI
ncbi:hypothetical protein N7E01_05960 [Neopusillimonas aromaticivorans]|nr:hypothetical protein [Neopusillimonas aromaticivorans]WJJ94507.1 hypothetical protein N7E01_05960 [Neopusillimonas aromaticivorans]